MSITKKTYELDLKVDRLISNYKKALSTMRAEGATDKTLAPFEKKLLSIESELLRLQKVGKEGIGSDPQAIQAYEREVQSAYKRLEKFGNSLSISAKNSKNFTNAISEAKKELANAKREAENAGKSFTKALQGLGFDKNTANNIASTVKNEDELNKRLKEELQLRQQNLQKAEAASKLAQSMANRQAAGRFGQNLIQGQSGSAATLTSASMASLKSFLARDENGKTNPRNEEGFKKTAEVFQFINSTLAKMIERGKSFAEIWAKLSELSERIFERPATEAFGDAGAMAGRIRQATDAREKIYRGTDAYRNLNEALGAAQMAGDPTKIKIVTDAYKELTEKTNSSAQASRNLTNAQTETERKMSELNAATNWLAGATRTDAQANREQAETLLESARAAKQTAEQFEQLKSHILMFFSVTSVISLFRQQIRQTFEDVKTLDKSFASIAMVTANSVSDMWGHYNQYATMAQELGQRTQSVIDASALFYQQGLDTNEALELTADTMKLATLAGIDYSQATDEMTAAIRGFRMEMDQGSHVTDVYSTLAASAAASVNEIAQAMVRTSSIANSAGMSFENTAAFLTQMIETTQESAENIGDLSEFLNN